MPAVIRKTVTGNMMSTTLHLSDGLRVRALISGTGAPVVLIHGVGLRAEVWAPQMAALADSHCVIAVDMPGHGGSDPLSGTPELQDFVAWAVRVIETLERTPVSLAGHSMGALIAAGLAVDRPDLLARVALLNAVYRRSPAARSEVLARAADISAGSCSLDNPLDRWFSPDETVLRKQTGTWLCQNTIQGYGAAYRAFATGDDSYADRIARIACPLLVLTGADDGNSTPDMARAIAAAAPLGRAVIIPGHRHMVPLTAPEPVSAALLDWLATEGAAT